MGLHPDSRAATRVRGSNYLIFEASGSKNHEPSSRSIRPPSIPKINSGHTTDCAELRAPPGIRPLGSVVAVSAEGKDSWQAIILNAAYMVSIMLCLSRLKPARPFTGFRLLFLQKNILWQFPQVHMLLHCLVYTLAAQGVAV